MRLHLLEHDPMEFGPTNVAFWASRRGHTCTVTETFQGLSLPRPENFDWLLVMGGSQHVWDQAGHPWLKAEKALIREALECEKPVLGICFGAQLLAEVLGGQVTPSRQPEIGWHEVSLTAAGLQAPLFAGVPRQFFTFHWHHDLFSLPPGCIRLSSSAATRNQAFLVPGKAVVGLQFHPEYTREMIRRYARRYGADWGSGPFIADRQTVLEQTRRLPETYWLMECLLDNLARELNARPV